MMAKPTVKELVLGDNVENIDWYAKILKGKVIKKKYTDLENKIIDAMVANDFDRKKVMSSFNFKEADLNTILRKKHIQNKMKVLELKNTAQTQLVQEDLDVNVLDDFMGHLNKKRGDWLNKLDNIINLDISDIEKDRDRLYAMDLIRKAILDAFTVTDKLQDDLQKYTENTEFTVKLDNGETKRYSKGDLVNEIVTSIKDNTKDTELEK